MTREENFMSEWYPDNDENDFLLNVRLWSKWDQQHFERMIRTATDLLDEMESKKLIECEKCNDAFTKEISHLITHMKHPGFLAKNNFGLSDDLYRKYIYERIKTLESIQVRYRELRDRFGSITNSIM